MAYSMKEGKELVVEAGIKLVESGLIARTWGNVSARVEGNQFVITPSGLAYETLTPDDIVPVTMPDCTWDESGLKPSSEKGVHVDAYELHPEANFAIHTHQINASTISISGKNFPVPADKQNLLGKVIPTAKYGITSTKKLKQNIYDALKANPSSTTVLMTHHGALCLGKTYEETFEIASALEEVSGDIIKQTCGGKDLITAYLEKAIPEADRESVLQDLGSSERHGDTFTLKMNDGSTYECSVESGTAVIGQGIAPRVSQLHGAIYRNNDVSYIKHDTNPYVIALSRNGKTEYPYLEDFAQIAGVNVKNESYEETEQRTQNVAIAKALKGRNACFIKGQGAICTGNSEFDAGAVELVLEKEAHAALYAAVAGDAKVLNPIGCALERTVYVAKYSKLASKKEK